MKLNSVVVLCALCSVYAEENEETTADQCEMPSLTSEDCDIPYSGYAFDPKRDRCVLATSCNSRELFVTKEMCEHDCPELRRPRKTPKSKTCGLNDTHCGDPYFVGWVYNENEEKCQLRRSCTTTNVFDSKAECMDSCYAKESVSDLVCKVPPESGPCLAPVTRWNYNPIARSCESFVYGGCLGNLNNFNTQEECEQFCEGVVANGMTCFKTDEQIPVDRVLKNPPKQEEKQNDTPE